MELIRAMEQPKRRYLVMFAGLVIAQIAIGLYGINAPVVWGHYGFHVAEHGLGARNLLRHGTWTHTTHARPTPPPKATLNFHHVSMLHPFVAVGYLVLGEHVWVPRLISLGFVLLTLCGVFLFCYRARGGPMAVITAAAFVFNPFNGAYCNLTDIQMVSLAGVIWTGVAMLYLFEQGPRLWSSAVMIAATLLGAFHDWPYFPVAFFMFAIAFWKLRPYTQLGARWTVRQIWYARALLAICCVLILAVFAQHFWRASQAGRLHDLMGSYSSRGGQHTTTAFLLEVLTRFFRQHTVTMTAMCVAWLGVVVNRRRFDLATLLMLSLLLGQTIYMFKFKMGFLFHEYRGYWYTPVFAFAAGDLIAGASLWLQRRFSGRALRTVAVSAFPLLFVGLMIHHNMTLLPRARRVAGSLNFSLRAYNPQTTFMATATVANALVGPRYRVFVEGGLGPRIEVWFLLNADGVPAYSAAGALGWARLQRPLIAIISRATLFRSRGWQRLARQGRVLAIDNLILIEVKAAVQHSVEHTRVAFVPKYRWLHAWLNAPNAGPRVLVPGDRRLALQIAQRIGSPPEVVGAVNRGTAPMLNVLPRRLVGNKR